MDNPKVSVVVPVYNVERYLSRCLQTLLNQTLQNIEIILVDDGSTDKCPELCDEYAKKDSRIKVIHKLNAGLGYARNSGMEIAKGEYVAFVDSDDFVEKDMLQRLYECAHQNSLDIIYCGYNTYSNNSVIASSSEEPAYKEYTDNECNDVLKGMLGNLGNKNKIVKYEMSVWHSLYKLETIKSNRIQFCSERDFCSEDIIFHIDLIRFCKKIAFIPDCLYYYCVNDNSLTKVFRTDRLERHIILFNEIERRLEKNNYKFPSNIAHNLLLLKIRYDFTVINHYNISFFKKYSYVEKLMRHEYIRKLSKEIEFGGLPIRYSLFFLLVKYRCTLFLTQLISLK